MSAPRRFQLAGALLLLAFLGTLNYYPAWLVHGEPAWFAFLALGALAALVGLKAERDMEGPQR